MGMNLFRLIKDQKVKKYITEWAYQYSKLNLPLPTQLPE